MKRISVLGLLLLVGQMTFAQASHNFKMERSKLRELVSPVNLVERESLKDLEGIVVPIGFDFSFYDGIVVDKLQFTEDGSLVGLSVDDQAPVFEINALKRVDLVDRNVVPGLERSQVRYSQQGARGSRVLVIEWTNVGFQKEVDAFNASASFLNFQLILTQKGNRIQYVYGQSKIEHPELCFGLEGPKVGVGSVKLSSQLFLTGAGNSPEPVAEMAGLDYYPPVGAQFVFFPKIMNIESAPVKSNGIVKLNAKVYPNPFANRFTIMLAKGAPAAKIVVRSPYGKVVFEGYIDDKTSVDLSGYDQGLYLIYLSSKRESIVKKILKR